MSETIWLFQTARGDMALATTPQQVSRVWLPETPQLPRGTSPDARTATWITRLIERIQLHYMGKPQDFRDVPLDLSGCSEFDTSVYNHLRQNVVSGSTTSYGDLATALGKPGAARAVAGAMRRNPVPLLVPCHRVLAANHGIGGFSGGCGIESKWYLLRAEGAVGPIV